MSQTGDSDMLVSWVEPDGVVDGYRVCQDHLDTDTAPGSNFPSECVDITAPNNQTTLGPLYPGGSYTIIVNSVSNNVYSQTVEQQLVMSKSQLLNYNCNIVFLKFNCVKL